MNQLPRMVVYIQKKKQVIGLVGMAWVVVH